MTSASPSSPGVCRCGCGSTRGPQLRTNSPGPALRHEGLGKQVHVCPTRVSNPCRSRPDFADSGTNSAEFGLQALEIGQCPSSAAWIRPNLDRFRPYLGGLRQATSAEAGQSNRRRLWPTSDHSGPRSENYHGKLIGQHSAHNCPNVVPLHGTGSSPVSGKQTLLGALTRSIQGSLGSGPESGASVVRNLAPTRRLNAWTTTKNGASNTAFHKEADFEGRGRCRPDHDDGEEATRGR